ncbi:MAG: dTMP kinase [Lachnospiraceae bacterium]|nr:dTMP kinase [Lachnospiraceae bacterium]
MTEKKGRFITFEGIDGSGKSTQIKLLKERILTETEDNCYDTFEPSKGPVGALLRQFLSGRMKTDERTMAALFASDRLDHLFNETDGICQKINQGIHVLCDRYLLSNYAYQGKQDSLDWVISLNAKAEEALRPDCHIFIDVTPEVALQRIEAGRYHREIYETEEQLTKIRSSYLSLFRLLSNKETIIVINGNQSVEKIADDIWNQVSELFSI